MGSSTTTICWKGRTLAADTQLTFSDDTHVFCHKIHLLGDNHVVAIAGDYDAEFHFKRWLMAGAKVDEWVASNILVKKPKFEAIYIDKNGNKWYYSNGPEALPIESRFFAIGSGGKIAMAGMHMGLNAVDAVLLAGDIDINTNKIVERYDIQTRRLFLKKPPVGAVLNESSSL